MVFSFPTSSFHPFFFFNDTATTEIYTLSLHDALPICPSSKRVMLCMYQIFWTYFRIIFQNPVSSQAKPEQFFLPLYHHLVSSPTSSFNHNNHACKATWSEIGRAHV